LMKPSARTSCGPSAVFSWMLSAVVISSSFPFVRGNVRSRPESDRPFDSITSNGLDAPDAASLGCPQL